MNNREEFEKWLSDYVEQEPKNFNRFEYKLLTVKTAWQEATTRQQKIIDKLESIIDEQRNSISYEKADKEMYKQQRNELLEALIELTKEKYQKELRRSLLNGYNDFDIARLTVQPYIALIEKATGKSWEEIKAGKR